MDSKQQLGLNYTEDFRIACRINGINCDEVLQYFVNKVSFYAFNGGEMDASAMVATNIILEAKEELGSNIIPVKDRKVQRVFLKHIEILSKLTGNPHLNTLEKIQESFYLMEEWALEMMPLVDYGTSLLVEDDVTLIISFDFNLLCKVNGLDVISVLQYFIDHVSLPVDRAVNISGVVKTESCMALFQMLLIGRNRTNSRIVRTDVYDRFTQKLQDIDEWMVDEKDLQIRIRTYRSFYKEWYDSLFKDLN